MARRHVVQAQAQLLARLACECLVTQPSRRRRRTEPAQRQPPLRRTPRRLRVLRRRVAERWVRARQAVCASSRAPSSARMARVTSIEKRAKWTAAQIGGHEPTRLSVCGPQAA